jgi:hypothetical protein
MSHHFATQEEELFKIGAVRIERLATLLHHGVKGRLEDIPLVEVRYSVVGVSTIHS